VLEERVGARETQILTPLDRVEPSTPEAGDRSHRHVSAAGTATIAEPRRLLIAENDTDIRLLLELHLRRAGFDVLVAADGEEALRIALSEPLDLVVLDIRMPLRDGLSVLGMVRACPETRELPVVLVSASVDRSQVGAGLERGANAYLAKPFQLSEVLTVIEQLLDQR
jgi:DNA-binding response OmpR family regulator